LKKLSYFVASGAAVLFVSACFALLTTRSSFAQGERPPTDVRVINPVGAPVPVNVTQLPAVQVGNGSGNPVPVTVTSLPPVAAGKTPVTISGSGQFSGPGLFGGDIFYNVPAGKTLMIEKINARLVERDSGTRHYLKIFYTHGGVARPAYYIRTDKFFIVGETALEPETFHDLAMEDVLIFADGGTQMHILGVRTHFVGAGGSETTYTITATGYLLDNPAP
jgi:hypothetical protein